MTSNRPANKKVYGLGMDTGGTYTDAAVVDLRDHKIIAKGKAPTTHQDLTVGLVEAVEQVLSLGLFDLEDITLVGLSTTLATNSVLEGKGGEVGLIGIGWTPDADWVLGAEEMAFIQGGHNVRGREAAGLRESEARAAIDRIAPLVDSMVVSSMFSVYNPSHEQLVRKIIRERHDLPVVAGHDLTSELGIMERTITAVLNARLIPIIDQFLKDAKRTLWEKGISAPMMVFKGNGTLMNIETARERPVDTILSGPAASALGGRILTGIEDCVVVDIGGTSTDVAILTKGLPRITLEGALIGRWSTRVEAVDIWTIALGGDSEIRAKFPRELIIGPERVVPLCAAASLYPQLKTKMNDMGEARFLMAYERTNAKLSAKEKMMVDHLQANGPLTPGQLKKDLDEIVLIESYIKSLKSKNIIIGIGLTPTDVLASVGRVDKGDEEASKLGVQLFSKVFRKSEEEFVSMVLDWMIAKIAEEVLKKLVWDGSGSLPNDPAAQFMIDLASGRRCAQGLVFKGSLDRPLVGIGAPAHIFLKPVGERLGVEVVVPENHEVGNAVGAACGQVSEIVDVFVYPRDKGYAVFSSFGPPIQYDEEGDAIASAKELAVRMAREKTEGAGGRGLQVECEIEEERATYGSAAEGEPLVQMKIRARATGNPTIVYENLK